MNLSFSFVYRKAELSLISLFNCMVIVFLINSGCTRETKTANEIENLLIPPQEVVDVGNEAPLIYYNRYLRGGGHVRNAASAGWQITHALAIRAGNISAEEKLLEQIKYNLKGLNTISANGGYPAQHDLNMTGTYAILRHAPDFWKNKLSKEQRHKIDLIMKAALIASAYTTSDATYANDAWPTTICGDNNLNRSWNPNFREGMFGNLLVGTVYFGGVEQIYEILNNYNHETFITQLKEAELDNIYETYTWAANHPESEAPSGEKITQNIKDYRFLEERLKDPFDVYYDLCMRTYDGIVNCGLNDGQGIEVDGIPTGTIASGCDSLPNKGKLGQLREFNSMDAGGPRSSISYAYSGFRPNLTNHVVVLIGGYWQPGEKADEILRRMDIGITDLKYKIEHGYRNYSKAHGSTEISDFKNSQWKWSVRTTIPLWEKVLKPYHQI